jgi:hypothetical protein
MMLLAYLFTFGEVIVEIAVNKARAWKRGISTGRTVKEDEGGEEEEEEEERIVKEDDSFKKRVLSASGEQSEGHGAARNGADSNTSALDISEQRGPKNTNPTPTEKQENRRENTDQDVDLYRPQKGHSSAGGASHVSHHRRTMTPDGDIESCGSGDYGINMQSLLCMMSTQKDDEATMLHRKTHN